MDNSFAISSSHIKERPPWPDPTPAMLAKDPLFEAIWQVILTWDINVPEQYSGYTGATGNHARAIYDAVKPFSKPPKLLAPPKPRPTIAELEAILNKPDDAYEVVVNPDGSISAKEVG